jgi:transcriptional regulator with XRE-family HTH domain
MSRIYDRKKKHLIDFGNRLRQQREYLGLSQEKASELLGISANFYGKVERGIHGLSYETLRKAKSIFHVSLDYLITGESIALEKSAIMDIINHAPEEKRCLLEELIYIASKLYDNEHTTNF